MYKVSVKNPLGEVSSEARLTVLMRPAIKCDSRFDGIVEVVAIDQNLNITCEISGYPKPNVTWFKERDEIKVDGVLSRARLEFGEKFGNLNVKKIERNEGGNYTCVAENEVGKAETTFKVKVLSVPLAPTELTVADISSYSCKFTWKTHRLLIT